MVNVLKLKRNLICPKKIKEKYYKIIKKFYMSRCLLIHFLIINFFCL